MEHDGNGWVVCGAGHRHWGRFGAAGLLLVDRPASDEPGPPAAAGAVAADRVLLQHRASWTANGGTWGIPGGARDSHEDAVGAALREAYEETGVGPGSVRVVGELVDDHGAGWSYTTVLADLVGAVVLVPEAESEELRWVDTAAVTALPLHPGFAGTWPRLRARL